MASTARHTNEVKAQRHEDDAKASLSRQIVFASKQRPSLRSNNNEY